MRRPRWRWRWRWRTRWPWPSARASLPCGSALDTIAGWRSMRFFHAFVSVLDAGVVVYVGVFFFINILFLFISFYLVGRDLRAEHVRPAIGTEKAQFMPSVTLLVPAYNEEVTIVESV